MRLERQSKKEEVEEASPVAVAAKPAYAKQPKREMAESEWEGDSAAAAALRFDYVEAKRELCRDAADVSNLEAQHALAMCGGRLVSYKQGGVPQWQQQLPIVEVRGETGSGSGQSEGQGVEMADCEGEPVSRSAAVKGGVAVCARAGAHTRDEYEFDARSRLAVDSRGDYLLSEDENDGNEEGDGGGEAIETQQAGGAMLNWKNYATRAAVLRSAAFEMSESGLPPPVGGKSLFVVQEPTPIKQNCTIENVRTTIDDLTKAGELTAPHGALLGRATARKRLFGACDSATAAAEKRARVVNEKRQVAEPQACRKCGLFVAVAQRREHALSHARIYSCGWKRCKYSWPVRAEVVSHMRSAHSVNDPRQVREMNSVERAAELTRVAERCFPSASLEQVAPDIEKVEPQQPAQQEDDHVSVVGNVLAEHARELQVLQEKTPAQRPNCTAVLKLAELPGHCHQRLEKHAASHLSFNAFGCNACGWQTQVLNRLTNHINKNHHGNMECFVDRRKGRSDATMNDMVMRCFANKEEMELVGWKEEEEMGKEKETE